MGQQDGSEQQEAEQELQQLEAEIEASRRQRDILERQSRRASSAAERLSLQLVERAREIQLAEDNVSRLEARIADLEVTMDDKRRVMLANNENVVELIAAINRLSKRPAMLALLKPDDALKTARSTSLMASLVPVIDARAAKLKEDLTVLAAIQTDLSDERFNLKNGLEALTDNQQRLALLMEERQAEAGQASERAQRLADEVRAFTEEAETLRELIAKLEQQAARERSLLAERARERAPVSRPSGLSGSMGGLRGRLPYPAVGPVVQRFGAKDGVGNAKGIRIRARQSAQVVSPFDGSVVFAGPFRNYGLLLIIDHGDGYHSLLAGFETLQSSVGQWVLMGEPVGTMPNEDRSNTEASDDLYLELRHNGEAINPLPWLQQISADAR